MFVIKMEKLRSQSWESKKTKYLYLLMLFVFLSVKVLYWHESWRLAFIFTLILASGGLSIYNLVAFFLGRPMYLRNKFEKGRPIVRAVILIISIFGACVFSFMIYRAVAVYVGAIPFGGHA